MAGQDWRGGKSNLHGSSSKKVSPWALSTKLGGKLDEETAATSASGSGGEKGARGGPGASPEETVGCDDPAGCDEFDCGDDPAGGDDPEGCAGLEKPSWLDFIGTTSGQNRPDQAQEVGVGRRKKDRGKDEGGKGTRRKKSPNQLTPGGKGRKQRPPKWPDQDVLVTSNPETETNARPGSL